MKTDLLGIQRSEYKRAPATRKQRDALSLTSAKGKPTNMQLRDNHIMGHNRPNHLEELRNTLTSAK